jgi:NAD(P)-dependent dehydrogenase (short-subunit alcohol dehydrogenase family)
MNGVTVVTGAAGGIGRAVVGVLLERGDAVVGVDLAGSPLPEHPRLAWVRGDLTDTSIVDAAFAAAAGFGAPTGLVMSAFADHHVPLTELTAPLIAAVFDQQAVAAWTWGVRLHDEHPADRDASIVHISSVHAHLAAQGKAAYAMAKAALQALTRAMAVEWGPDGIRCNAVLPGFVPVPRNAHRWSDPAGAAAIARHLPLRRVVTAEDVAHCAAFLDGPLARGVTGACLTVDAGMSAALPEWA